MDSLSINTVSSDLGEILIEDSAATLETVGAIYFSDTSADGFHIPTFAQTGGPELGVFTVNILDDATGTGDQNGQVDWTYAVDNAAVQYLAAGQSVDLVFRVTIIDSDGTGPDQYVDVTITLTGTNEAPLFTSTQSAPAPLTEDALTPITGTLTFNDIDTLDTHSISAVALAKTGDIAGLTATDDALKSLLTTVANSTTTATGGSIDWTFTNSAAPFQYLQVGETLTLAYTLTLSDGHGGTDTRTLTFTVSGSNDGPVAAADTDGVTEAGGVANAIAGIASTSGNVLTNDSDADYNDQIAVTALAGGTLGVALAGTYGALTLNADGSYSYALDDALAATQALNGTPGTESFSYTITDEHGETSTASLTITVTGANDTPVAADDSDAVTEAGGVANATAGTPSASGNVLTNDSDVDAGDSKSVSAISGGTVGAALAGTYGALTLNADGSYSYDLDDSLATTQALNGTPGTEIFTYTVSDGAGATATATLTVTVTGANDTLVLVADTGAVVESGTDALGAVAGTPAASGNVLDNDTDVDADDGKSVSTVSFGMTSVAAGAAIAGTYGSLTLGANGAYSYTLNNSLTTTQELAVGQSVTEIFTYAAADTAGLGGTQTLTITVTGTNDAPVAVADIGTPLIEGGYTVAGIGSSVGNVLTNDTDIDTGDTQTVVGVAAGAQSSASGSVGSAVQGAYGILTIGSDGTYSYALDDTLAATQALTQGQTVTETFTYTMQDGSGVASSATVSFGVTGTNDAPIVTDPTTATVIEAGFAGAGISSVTGAAGAANWTDVDGAEAGDLHITAVGFGGTASSAFAIATQDLSPVAGQFQVNTTTNEYFQQYSSTAALSGGGFVVTWASYGEDGQYWGIFGQRYDANGVKADGQFLVNTTTANDQQYSSTTALSGGGFVVTWSSYGEDGQYWGIFGQRYDAGGVKAGGQFLVNTTTAGDQFLSSAVALSGGGFVVTWQSYNEDGSGDGIYGQRYDASGVKAGGQFLVNTTTTLDQAHAATTALSNGGFVVTWSSHNEDGSGWGIYGQRYDASGTKVDGQFRANTTTSSDQLYSSPAGLSGGGFVVTWMSFNEDGSGWGVYGQRYDASGVPAGAQFRVNMTTFDSQLYPQAMSLSDGGFLVTWSSYGEDGSDWGVYGQRYEANGVASGSPFLVNEYTQGTQINEWANNSIGTAQLADGKVIAVWDGQSATDTYGISGRLFTFSQSDPNALPGEMAIAGTYGTLYLEADGDYRYVLDNTKAATQALAAGAHPTETFTYTTSNRSGGAGNEATGQIVITVDGANDAPVAVANVGTPLVEAGYGVTGIATSTGNVLANDTDVDTGDTKAVTGVAAGTPSSASGSVGSAVQGTYGSITIAADGSYTYTLDDTLAATRALTQGQSVTETFTYTMQDAAGVAATTTVSFGVTGTNDAPMVTSPNTGAVIEAGATAAGTPSVTGMAGGANWADDDAGEAATLHITAAGVGGTATDAFAIGSTTPAPVAGQFQISAPAPDSQSFSSVAALSDGGFVVTWSSYDTGGSFWEVFGQRYDATGAATGGAFHINTTTAYDQVFSTTTALSGGGFVVTWRSDDDGWDSGIYAQRYDASGAKAGGEFLVNTIIDGPQTFSSTAALAGGGFVVTWDSGDGASNDGSGLGIHGQRFDANGAKVGDEFTVNMTTFNTQYFSSTAALSDGGFVVTWTSSGTDGSGEGIYGQRYDAAGAKAGTEFLVNTTTTGHQEYSSTIGLPGGGFVVTWQSSVGDGSGYGVYGQRYDANGVTVGGQFLVNTTTASDQSAPQTMALSDGGFVVSWTSSGEDGAGAGVYAQRYDANGAASGVPFQLNDYTTGDQYQGFPNSSSAIAQLADGRLVAVWDGDSATETNGVSGRIFTVPGEMAIEGDYGTLYLKANGDYRYVLDNGKAATQALDDGDSPTETFTYTTSNRSGGAGNEATGQIVVTVTGANDAPVIGTVTQPAAVAELGNASAQDIAPLTGTISVSDVDGSDTLAPQVGVPVITITNGGNPVTGVTLPAGLTAAGVFTAVIDNAASANGAARSVTWTYDPSAVDLDFLAQGDTITISYPVSVTDGTTPSVVRNVTITITGANDAPTLTLTAGHFDLFTANETNVGLTLSGSLTLTDPDQGDAHSFDVAVAATGTTTGLPGNAALLSMFGFPHADGVYNAGDGTADLAWTFDSGSEAFDYLAPGETLTLTYTVTADDSLATGSHDIVVTITGTNDYPKVGATYAPIDAGSFVENSASTQTLSGDFTFTDLDMSQDGDHIITVPTVYINGRGSGAASMSSSALLTYFNANLSDPLTDGTDNQHGKVEYSFSAADTVFDYLKEGESLTLEYVVQIRDGGPYDYTSQSVLVTITGKNDGVDITSGPITASATAQPDSYSGIQLNGFIEVTDLDTDDFYRFTVDKAVAVTGTGPADGRPTDAQLLSGLSIYPYSANPGSQGGQYYWGTSFGESQFHYLAAGETVILTYTVTLRDSLTTSDMQTITLTITGSNETPTITLGAGDSTSGAVTETNGGLLTSGTLTVSDADRTDVDVAAVDSVSVVSGATNGISDATLKAMMSVAAGDTTAQATGDGKLNWTFNSATEAFNHLATGETLVLDYVLSVSDGHVGGSDYETVRVTITGTNDGPAIVVNAGDSASGTVTETNAAGLIASDTLTVQDADLTDVVTASVLGLQSVSGPANGIGAAALEAMMTVSTGDVTGTDGTGPLTWTFNSGAQAFDYLGAADTLTINYVVGVVDAEGVEATQVVSITVQGSNDAPTVVSGGVVTGTGTEALTGMTTIASTGSFAATDLDLTDTLSVAEGATSVVWSGGVAPQGVIDALTAPNAFTVTNSGSGHDATVNWIWNATSDLNFLAQNETLTITTPVTVSDGHGGSVSQDVVITVTGTNDAPVITNGVVTGSLAEPANTTGQPGTFLSAAGGSFSIADADVNGQSNFSYNFDTSGAHPNGFTSNFAQRTLSVDQKAALINGLQLSGITGNDGTVNWNYHIANDKIDFLRQGESLTLYFAVTADDQSGAGNATASTVIAITITGTNDPIQQGSATITGSVSEPVTGNVTTSGTIPFTDADFSNHAVQVTALTSGLTGGTGTLTASITDPAVTDGIGEVTWNYSVSSAVTDYLAQGQQVTETFRVRIIDSSGEILDNNVTITITGTNDNPVITSVAQNGAVVEDGALIATGQISSTDVDTGATAAYWGDMTGTYGSFVVNAASGAWTYTLANAAQQALADGESHVETFTVTVTDEFNGTATQDVTITVTGTNDSPVITSGAQTGTVQEDVTLTATGTVTVTDVDNGATRSFAGNQVGTYGGFAIDGGTGVWTYMLANMAHQALAEGESHVETFTVTVTDDKGATATQDVVITVTGTNDVPVITSGTQAGNVVEDGTLIASGQVIASDVDNGATRAFTGDETTDYGSFVVNATNGAWTYTLANGSAEIQSLAEGQIVTETFTVTVTDDKGGTATQDVTITVTGANDGPVISSGPQSGAVAEDGTLIRTGQVTAFDADADAVLTFTGDETTTHGSFVVNEATGAWTYTLDNVAAQALTQGQIVTETFTVTVTDDEGATTTQDVIVTVTGANDRPVITSGPQTGAVTEDATLIATGQVMATDADTGAILTYSGGQAFVPTRFLPAPGHGDGTTDYGSFVVDASTGAWTYTLNNAAAQALTEGQIVTETFTVIVTDDRGATATQNVVVTVTGTNDVPTIAAHSTAGGIVEAGAGVAGTATVTGDLSLAGANWSDVDNSEDTALAVTSGGSGSDPQAGLVFDGSAPGAQPGEARIAGVYGDLFLMANGGFRYVLNDADSDTNGLDGDETASETFHYSIANHGGGAGNEATGTLTVNIQGSNDAATITVTNPAPVLESDTTATVGFLIADRVTISDADINDVAQDYIANSGTISAAGATPASGVLTDLVSFDAATGAISYDRGAFNWLDSDESVTYTVNFMAQSGDDGAVAQALIFTIDGQNDVPVAVADVATRAENAGGTFDLVANDTDADIHESQTLQSFSLGTVTGLGTLNGGQLADIADDFAIVGNQLVFSPSAGLPGTTEAIYDRLAPGQTATIVINYMVHDDSGATSTSTFTLTITGAAETFNGTADGETIIGSNRADAMYGNGGDDTLTGNAGDDALHGGDGDDTLVGGSGNDALHADGGNDTLVGGNDIDTAYLNGNWADYMISGSGGTYTLIRDGQTVTAGTIELFSFNGGPAVAAATILNDAPTLTGGSGTFDENVSDSTVLVTVVGSDLDLATAGLGESLRYAITGGNPNGVFEIDANGGVSVASGKMLDYEAGGATRALTVTVTDAHGATATATVTITVNDLNDEAPVFTSGASASVAENGAASALVYTAHANDADSTAHFGPVSYALGGTDAGAFTLDSTTGELRLNASADHETKPSYTVVITASQGTGPSTAQTVTIAVLDVNEPPANLALAGQSLAEYAVAGTVVGTLSASDVENEALTYSLLNDAGGRFAIVGNQIVAGGVLTDYEQAATHVVQVRVTDSRGGFVDQNFIVTIGDVSPENVVGTGNAETMIGGTANDSFQGLGGNDVIDGGGGADVMTGGLGDDTYYVDNGFDNVVEANNEGTDTIYASVNYSLGGRFAETLILTGTGNLQALGNARDNVLTGNSGNNLLNGQAGADIMTGGLGDDIYIVDTGADSVVELLNGGSDEVQTSLATYTLATNVEKLLGTRGIGQTLNGNALANSITGGAGNDIIDGAGGADVMTGGLGNDVYYVNHIGDNVVELDGQGTDTIYSSVNYSLGGRFAETLTLTGTADVQALGNASANRLVGNSGANILNGFQGSDTLTGGAGQDQFRFTTALGTGNIDTITDFLAIDDMIALSKAVFAALGPLGTLGTDAFVVGTAAADASDRIIYNSTNGNLLYDADGTGSGAATLFAHIGTGLTLTHDDFLIIA